MTKKQTTLPELEPKVFKKLGYRLIDQIANLIQEFDVRKVTTGLDPAEINKLLGQKDLPDHGKDPSSILEHVTKVLLDHSLFNGHPKFLGYITSSPMPNWDFGRPVGIRHQSEYGCQDT